MSAKAYTADFKLETKLLKDRGIICQELTEVMVDLQTKVTRWVFDTREETLKAALIELGWTPPKGK